MPQGGRGTSGVTTGVAVAIGVGDGDVMTGRALPRSCPQMNIPTATTLSAARIAALIRAVVDSRCTPSVFGRSLVRATE
jgi:uncharacterized protein (DUF1786 family)